MDAYLEYNGETVKGRKVNSIQEAQKWASENAGACQMLRIFVDGQLIHSQELRK